MKDWEIEKMKDTDRGLKIAVLVLLGIVACMTWVAWPWIVLIVKLLFV